MDALVAGREQNTDTTEAQIRHDGADLAIRYRDQAIRLSLQGYFAESESFSREALRLRPRRRRHLERARCGPLAAGPLDRGSWRFTIRHVRSTRTISGS